MTSKQIIPRDKRYLNADYLFKTLKRRFDDVADNRRKNSVGYPMVDILIADFAMLSLKEPSLLSFEEHEDESSVKQLNGLKRIPSKTQMRTILRSGLTSNHSIKRSQKSFTNCNAPAN